jgi:HlyD family secretion protein
MIEEGAVVRNRQEIIKLPDVSEMKLRVKIHESHINQLRLEQPAFVVLDSMPDQRFRGKVNKVAPLPDSQSRYGNPDLKVYATEILITDKLPNVKPGVSARAEIIITNLTDTLSVPIQAVTTRKGKQVVFLASAPQEPVPVTVGLFNTKFIEICSGLKAGDPVLLAPPFDTKEKDLGGAIIADEETLPAGPTNQPSPSAASPTDRNENHQSAPSRTGGKRFSEPGAPGPASNAGTEGGSAAGERVGGGSESPRDSLRPGKRGRSGAGELAGSSTNRQDMLKRFDADGDGKLNESELAAMREWAARRRGTNAPPAASLVN